MPLAIDLYCGLGGWTEGFLSEGWDVIGFDIERHQYGDKKYPAQLVLQDVLTLHGAQFAGADCIVASPPCQEFSYRAMPWKRAKALPPPYLGMRLFWACFRIQHEACEAAGRYIPLVVENVCGAQRWVGDARWHFGSYYLWGDLPALMPASAALKQPGRNFHFPEKYGIPSPSFHGCSHEPSVQSALGVKASGIKLSEIGFNVAAAQRYRDGIKVEGHLNKRNGESHTRHLTNPREHVSRKDRPAYPYSPGDSRKAASAEIAKIPFPLSQHIARVFKPDNLQQIRQDLPYTEAEPLIC